MWLIVGMRRSMSGRRAAAQTRGVLMFWSLPRLRPLVMRYAIDMCPTANIGVARRVLIVY